MPASTYPCKKAAAFSLVAGFAQWASYAAAVGAWAALALVLLGARFWKLSRLDGLAGRARTVRLGWLVVLASGLTLSGYLVVLMGSARIPSAHAASSAWPWGHAHPIATVLLACLVG